MPTHPRTPRSERPDHVFVAPDRGRDLAKWCLFTSLVVATVGLAITARQPGLFPGLVAGLGAFFGVVCWAALLARVPQRVTIRGPVIEIQRTGRSHTYDLEDPAVDVRVRDGEIAFGYYLDNWTTVRATEVDWKVFSDVVMELQNRADRNAEERERRFAR
jgi:hypothetical protein